MTPDEAADRLFGTKTERCARWECFRLVQRSVVLANIAQLHAQGRVSYLTSLLLAIDALSLRAIEQGSRFPPPTSQDVALILRGPLVIARLETVVRQLAEFDELTTAEMIERAKIDMMKMSAMKINLSDLG